MNVKTSDKYLQFGQAKGKSMLVGKRKYSFHIPNLQVDTWKSEYDKEGNLIETFDGKKTMENTNELTYLGVQLSCDGSNMNTIIKRRNKQSGNKKSMNNLLKPLGKYTFECGFIFFNSMVRNSVLYATEVMYNLKESEKREIEKIEEGHLKNIFSSNTGIQVPLHIMYLDGGQVPARFQIDRYRLNFLQYILQEEETSLLYTMLRAQGDTPVKGDWFSDSQTTLKEFNLNLSNSQIKGMSKNEFHKITKVTSEAQAFKYLTEKQKKGKKGRNIMYHNQLEMACYLNPNNQLNLEDQRLIFQIRCEINPLPANKGNPGPCPMNDCQEILNNAHIFQCETLRGQNQGFEYGELINGNLNQIREGVKIWRTNMEKLEEKLALDSVF